MYYCEQNCWWQYFGNDRLISIPDADRVRDERNLHPERRVVIVQNDEGIYSVFLLC